MRWLQSTLDVFSIHTLTALLFWLINNIHTDHQTRTRPLSMCTPEKGCNKINVVYQYIKIVYSRQKLPERQAEASEPATWIRMVKNQSSGMSVEERRRSRSTGWNPYNFGSVKKCNLNLLKRVRHFGCIDFEGGHYQAGSTTKHMFCTLAADIAANRQLFTLQMVKYITYIVMLPHATEDYHACLHTMTTVYKQYTYTHFDLAWNNE